MDFEPGFHLLMGQNAQGKTNVLEAIYLLATLRSFRGAGGAQMVRHGQKGYFVGARVMGRTEHEIKLYWSPEERRLGLDNRPIRKLSEYWGLVRAVVFCSEDLQLLKGTASRRRRYLDLLLAQSHSGYLPLLQRYMQALRSRNALLKQRVTNLEALDGFSDQLVQLGNELMRHRRELLPRILPLARTAYGRIAQVDEEFRLEYECSVKEDFAVELAKTRGREQALRVTCVGPHRDDLRLVLQDRSAAQFASEGQKRSIVIALKIAQAEYLTEVHGVPPILLIDDIMGELDLNRRSGFLPVLERVRRGRSQVFMTATEENWPRELSRELIRWNVTGGKVGRIESGE